jgi:glycosyltransferase involved in cell wall biosynthesis
VGTGPAAVVLTPYAVDSVFVRGGAQRVAAELCDRLTELGWTIHVIECLAWRDTIVSPESFVAGMAGHAATTRRWRDAAPSTAISAADAGDAVRAARLVLVLDRAVGRLDTAAHRVLLLSNLVYYNEHQAAAYGGHDAVWVPSEYLARLCAAVRSPAPVDVHIVPPALADSRCDAAAHEPLRTLDARVTAAGVPRERRLLFPHRADPDKGLTTALIALQHLLKEDRWALIAVRPGECEGADATAVVNEALRDPAVAGIAEHVFWTPWLPQPEVYCLFGLAGVTLMPTMLDEGFGLVAVESVMQGVPVVARSAGNLRLLAERFPGVHLADEVTEVVRAAAAVSGRPVPPEQRRAVRKAFSVAAQRAAVTAALVGAASGA